MFCGKFHEFVVFGDTVEVIFEEVIIMMEADDHDIFPEAEDLEYFQVFPVVIRNSGYQFVDPQTQEILG